MTATRTVVITCDGPICAPTAPEIAGPLGGAHITVTGQQPVANIRRTLAAEHGWMQNPATKADLCPVCKTVLAGQIMRDAAIGAQLASP